MGTILREQFVLYLSWLAHKNNENEKIDPPGPIFANAEKYQYSIDNPLFNNKIPFRKFQTGFDQ